jgi:trigger factor
MKVTVATLPKSQYELLIELSAEEMKPYLDKAVEKLGREVKVEGFRPGKATFEVLKNKIGEQSIWEEAGYIAINKTLDQAIRDNIKEDIVGQPQVNVTKLAPGNPLEYKVVVAILPSVTIGEYKNFKIKSGSIKVGEPEVEKILSDLAEMRVKETISDAPAKDGDKAVVDISIFLDKVPLEGGQGKDTAVVIGKGYVVPGFDKKLIGAKAGDEREFDLPYPDTHYQKNLAGKLVQFKVKIKSVYSRELPARDDTFAIGFGLKSLAELKENIKATLVKEEEAKAKQKAEIKIIEKIIDNAKFGDIPELLIKNEGETMLAELEHNLEHQGAKLEDYLKSLNKTRQELLLDTMPDAVRRVKSALVIRKIAETEKISVEHEEIHREMEAILKHYADDDKIRQKVESHEYHHYLENMLTNQKVMVKLGEWNLEK